MSKIDWILEQMDKETRGDSGMCAKSNSDRALFHLLTRFKSELPELDDYFHKAFRQVDVTDSGHTDMAIWCLLHDSKLFWRLFEQAQGEKQAA